MDLTLRSQIRDYVTQRLKMHGDLTPLDDDALLFSSGRLDSLDAVELVMSLEADYGMDFSRLSFDLTLLDSVQAIGSLLRDFEAIA